MGKLGSRQDNEFNSFLLDTDNDVARKVQDTSLAPGKRTIHKFGILFDSGDSDDMTVDGSSTPVVFTMGPPAGETWYLTGALFGIEDSGTLDIEDFGSLPGLTNGWLLEQVINSIAHEFVNLKTNFGMATIGTTRGGLIGASAGFLNTSNAFAGSIEINPPVTLVGDNSDIFRATVRDNLGGLNFLKAAISFWRII